MAFSFSVGRHSLKKIFVERRKSRVTHVSSLQMMYLMNENDVEQHSKVVVKMALKIVSANLLLQRLCRWWQDMVQT